MVKVQGCSDHQLQQLLLRALVQVGPLKRHQLAGGGVAGHAHQAQVVEAPPCQQREQRGAQSVDSLDAAAWGGLQRSSLTQLGEELVVGWLGRQPVDVIGAACCCRAGCRSRQRVLRTVAALRSTRTHAHTYTGSLYSHLAMLIVFHCNPAA